ncbi:MAG TPA: SH3 domain-containing protein [Hyphomicrobiaceae bacterium]|nr:SH3 domain-containing protein [Hyphomicrobiaceae bacterium]
MPASGKSGLGPAALCVFILGAAVAASAAEPGGAPPAATGASGLPLPRFVSLKADRVNLRTGPGTEYPAAWVFRRAGLPLEVVKEVEGWRQVRDAEGTTGWMLQSFLSGRRTALVLPWEVKPDKPPPQVPIRSSDSDTARARAVVEAGVIANVHSCDGRWCDVSIGDYRGWLEQKNLWGVYEGEVVK